MDSRTGTDSAETEAPSSIPSMDFIHLNVGGVPYTTSKATLTRYQYSVLGSMFSQDPVPLERDQQGQFLIDRDGKVFRYVLNFLRDEELILPEDFSEHGQLMAEAKFYQLGDLVDRLSIHLNVGGVFYTTTRQTLVRSKSRLQAMFKEPLVVAERDQNNRYIIDGDGDLFQHVLDFMENGRLLLPEKFNRFKELEDEAEYYRIEAMKSAMAVHLSVSGVRFKSTRKILTKYPGSVLEEWFSQTPVPLRSDGKGCYIVDGDHEAFRHVLHMMENEHQPPGSEWRKADMKERIASELRRYKLTRLQAISLK